MRRTILREKDDRFCEAEIRLEDGELAITGSEGEIISREEAEERALDYWTSFFEDSPGEIGGLIQRFGHTTVFNYARDGDTDERSLARYVVAIDGSLHGLDVHSEDGDRIFIMEGGGCIHDTLKEWFPELAPLIPWHLNHMNAGCEHQGKLGWGHGRDVALSAADLTPVQCKTLNQRAQEAAEALRTQKRPKVIADLLRNRQRRHGLLQRLNKGSVSVHDDETFLIWLNAGRQVWPVDYADAKRYEAALQWELASLYPVQFFKAKIYKDSIGAPCPVCGYEYGTAWLKRELPPEIVTLAETVCPPEKT